MSDQLDKPGSAGIGQGPIDLSGPQQRLFEALTDHGDLAARYRGAIHVLESPPIPDRFAMAAHNLRELMDGLPEVINVPKKGGFSLKPEVNKLDKKWGAAKNNSECFDGEEWGGEIGPHLQGYFLEMESVFDANNKYNRKRRERYEEMVRQTDPSSTPISEQVERRLFKEWKDIRRFLLAVCHHGKKTDYEEFSGYVERLEVHILRRLRPSTFETQEKLDRIINEAEGK